jgi:type VI secretion system secreted protein VgrG
VRDILFAGKKRFRLIGSGSYLRIEARKIGYGTTENYVRKVKRTYLGASASMSVDLPSHD